MCYLNRLPTSALLMVLAAALGVACGSSRKPTGATGTGDDAGTGTGGAVSGTGGAGSAVGGADGGTGGADGGTGGGGVVGDPTGTTAVAVATFLDSLGVCTHVGQ